MENSLSIPRTLAEDTATTLAVARQRLIEQLHPDRRDMNDMDIFRMQLDDMRKERKSDFDHILQHVDQGFREVRADIRAINVRIEERSEKFHDTMTAMDVRAAERSDKFHQAMTAMDVRVAAQSEKFHDAMTAMDARAADRSKEFHDAFMSMQVRSDEIARRLHEDLAEAARATSDGMLAIQKQMADNAKQGRIELDTSIGELRADFREMQRGFKWMIGSQFAMMIFFMGAILHLPHVF